MKKHQNKKVMSWTWRLNNAPALSPGGSTTDAIIVELENFENGLSRVYTHQTGAEKIEAMLNAWLLHSEENDGQG